MDGPQRSRISLIQICTSSCDDADMFRTMFHSEGSDLIAYMRRGKYKDKEKCHGDITDVLGSYSGLRLKFGRHDGSKKDLIHLSGTIPVPYK